ncbi:MAG: zinc ABC transporter substrate-binding protein [Thaumarchaeota archaeon]|nr:zinc ABC transporter substrate-binding protein [Nitrososphaerota archaeon]
MKSGKKTVAIAGGIAVAVIAAIVIGGTNDVVTGPKTNLTGSAANTTSQKIRVMASFFPMYEFARNVAGDKADVSVFIPIGEEPHGWEPPTRQVQDVQNSQLFIYNGAGVEAFIPTFLSAENFPNTTFVRASQGIKMQDADVQHMDSDESGPVIAQGGKDPHVWNDPILAEQEVRTIGNAMEKADPANAKYYENNTDAYIGKLAKLDRDIRSGLADCQTRTFVSFHNAFNYFSQRYNLTDIWISGLAPEAEIAPQDLARVENTIKTNNVKTVFSEDLVDPKLAQTLAEDTGAQVRILSPLEGINKTEQKQGVTFLDKWYQNLDNLKEAMGCQ